MTDRSGTERLQHLPRDLMAPLGLGSAKLPLHGDKVIGAIPQAGFFRRVRLHLLPPGSRQVLHPDLALTKKRMHAGKLED